MNDLAARPASMADLAARRASLADLAGRPFEITLPPRQLSPLILASPHSGRVYPDEFAGQSCLAEIVLRQSEDCFVDRLVSTAPQLGVPLISALFPRVFVDPNREATELDQDMFAEKLPMPVNGASPRVLAGLGVIPRLAANEQEIVATVIHLISSGQVRLSAKALRAMRDLGAPTNAAA